MSLDITLHDITGDYTTTQLFDYNITHNLGIMAQEAGLYITLWRPYYKDVVTGKDQISRLEMGLKDLKKYPEYYKRFNPKNKWGNYDELVKCVELYLEACEKYPNAIVAVSA